MKAVYQPRPAHRHSVGHEHEYEPQYGLPELLPAGEKLLWQGSPDARALAIEVFHVRKLALYFVAILLLRAAFVLGDGGGVVDVLKSWAWLAPMAAIAVGIMLALARLAARTTVYSITDKRVIMRIGIVLTVAYNLPFKRIEAAGLMLRGTDGHGDVPITLRKGEQIAILQLWPHARPWHVVRPQPMLRGLKNAAQVGQVLARAWQDSQDQGELPTVARAEARSDVRATGASHAPEATMPALARTHAA
jgi:Bacterial PH domain